MLKNHWFDSLAGYISIEVHGKHVERFLNRCIEDGIPIWSIQRLNDNTLRCFLYARDVKRIRFHLKRTECKLRIKDKQGFPFFLKKIRTRVGLVIGLVFCLMVIFLLSNIVWSIQVTGASPEVEHKVRQAVKEIGVKRGNFIFFIPSTQEIQQKITEEMEEVTWVGVKRNGTLYSFDIVEKKLPEEKPALNPRHLVAKKKAVIHKMFVEQGQAVVQEKDVVQKGELLVSGFIGNENNIKAVPAKAQVLGEVWYLSEASVPLKTTIVTNTGRKQTKHMLQIGKLDMPFWGFKNESFQKREVIVDKKPLYFLKWKMPITYIRQSILEVDAVERTYSKEEAVEVAKEMARKALIRRVPRDAEIKGEKILHQSIENGKVNLKIHFQVIEEIAKEQPIIQGD